MAARIRQCWSPRAGQESNRYSKRAALKPAGAAAHLPAGVTEVMVVADDTARADCVAADLLAQAEHGPDAQSLLVTTSVALAQEVAQQVQRQSATLSRAGILAKSI